uniref:Uncharacterized protein n=1 Tax=Sinocyclocheilus grahami TaxID=75366 RepID=A0A672PQE0_SINGR
MAEDGGNISEDHQLREAEGSSSLPRTFIRLNDLSGGGERTGAAAEEASPCGGEPLPYPSLAPVVFFYLKQTTRPRSWCLKMVCNPYPFKLKSSPGWHSPVQVGRHKLHWAYIFMAISPLLFYFLQDQMKGSNDSL